MFCGYFALLFDVGFEFINFISRLEVEILCMNSLGRFKIYLPSDNARHNFLSLGSDVQY